MFMTRFLHVMGGLGSGVMLAGLLACGGGGTNTDTPPASTAPVITAQPSSQTVTVGQTAAFTVVASGTAPLHYQWKKDGSNVGTDSASYSIISAQTTDAGSYTVTISNTAGTITSSAATLLVDTNFYGITGYGPWSESYTPGANHVYYLDAVSGDDTYNGLSSTANTVTRTGPWKTLAKAQAMMTSGDTLYMAAGNYGDFAYSYTTNMTNWITYKALDPNLRPVIGNVQIASAGNINRDFYIRFDGIDFHVYNPSMTATSIPYHVGISLYYGNHIEIRNCEIHDRDAIKYHVMLGINAQSCSSLLFYKNDIHTIQAGIDSTNSSNITASQNYVHHLGGGAGLVQRSLSTNCIYEYNHIYDSDWKIDDTCSLHSSATAAGGGCAHVLTWDQPNMNPHNSGLNILHPNSIWRGNIVHHIGYNALITFYGDDNLLLVSCFTNILIENNLFYDGLNELAGSPVVNMIQHGKIGDNITIRNNTFVASYQYSNVAAASLGPGIWTGSSTMAAGYNGSGVHIYNNVVIGKLVAFPALFDVKKNIIWSFSNSTDPWTYVAPPTTNYAAVTTASGSDFNASIQYFLDGFFNGINGLEDITFGHGQLLDFTLTQNSPAVDFGDPAQQPSDSLGSIDSNGFIQKNGVARDGSHHSAGCYEFGTPFRQ